MSTSQQENVQLDPYTAEAEKGDVTLDQKIKDLHSIIQSAKTGMLVTRDSNGNLHSRAMNLASPHSNMELNLFFIANNVSHKFEEINNDAHVNVSFYEPSSTNWVSYSGQAKVTQDKELIKKYWSSIITGYIGNLKDGVHKGDQHDPRVAVIEVIPDEIRYWITKHSAPIRVMEVAAGAATGKATSPGELRTITKKEIQLTEGLHTKS